LNVGEWFRRFLLVMLLLPFKTAKAVTCESKAITYPPVQFFGATSNRTYRTEVLDCYVFDSLNEVRRMTEEWMHRYNHERPHESLGRLPPVLFAMAQSHHPLL
jgi:putative transposase